VSGVGGLTPPRLGPGGVPTVRLTGRERAETEALFPGPTMMRLLRAPWHAGTPLSDEIL